MLLTWIFFRCGGASSHAHVQPSALQRSLSELTANTPFFTCEEKQMLLRGQSHPEVNIWTTCDRTPLTIKKSGKVYWLRHGFLHCRGLHLGEERIPLFVFGQFSHRESAQLWCWWVSCHLVCAQTQVSSKRKMSLKFSGNYNARGLSGTTNMLQQGKNLDKILLWHLSFKTPGKGSYCDQASLAEGGLCSALPCEILEWHLPLSPGAL